MTKSISVLTILLLVTACNNSKQKEGKVSKSDTITKTISNQIQSPVADLFDTTSNLDYFISFPDTIDGCSSYFTYDSIKIENGKYIFISDFADLALIKIAGKEYYLHRDSLESKELSEVQTIEVFKGSGFKAILNTKIVKTVDELNYYTGTLEIIGDKFRAKYMVRGEGGC